MGVSGYLAFHVLRARTLAIEMKNDLKHTTTTRLDRCHETRSEYFLMLSRLKVLNTISTMGQKPLHDMSETPTLAMIPQRNQLLNLIIRQLVRPKHNQFLIPTQLLNSPSSPELLIPFPRKYLPLHRLIHLL